MFEKFTAVTAMSKLPDYVHIKGRGWDRPKRPYKASFTTHNKIEPISFKASIDNYSSMSLPKDWLETALARLNSNGEKHLDIYVEIDSTDSGYDTYSRVDLTISTTSTAITGTVFDEKGYEQAKFDYTKNCASYRKTCILHQKKEQEDLLSQYEYLKQKLGK